MDFQDYILNHIKTIHASAQFALAETQSGIHLQRLFPELEEKVVPVLRDAQMKYKKPAVEKFKTQFEKKGRGSLQNAT
ncbi:MAG: DUF4442 domain-containing protein [Thiovulaceae bacterium]|nr:DUF4442 domain-containing protein [Sulfurimonadaceae bacterium]